MTSPPAPPVDLMRYDLLVQEALKGMVRKVLVDAARDGLPGEHHFFISFRTDFPGVRLSQRMRERYPDEMTVVLQHQFWDLGVTEYAFEVGLSFGGVPERLLVPFDAMTGFFDPSVQFGLKFELHGEVTQLPAEPEAPPARAPAAQLAPPKPPVARSADLRSVGSEATKTAEPKEAGAKGATPARKSGKPAKGAASEPSETPSAPAASGTAAGEPASPEAAGGDEADKRSAQVLSLDAFRKRN